MSLLSENLAGADGRVNDWMVVYIAAFTFFCYGMSSYWTNIIIPRLFYADEAAISQEMATLQKEASAYDNTRELHCHARIIRRVDRLRRELDRMRNARAQYEWSIYCLWNLYRAGRRGPYVTTSTHQNLPRMGVYSQGKQQPTDCEQYGDAKPSMPSVSNSSSEVIKTSTSGEAKGMVNYLMDTAQVASLYIKYNLPHAMSYVICVAHMTPVLLLYGNTQSITPFIVIPCNGLVDDLLILLRGAFSSFTHSTLSPEGDEAPVALTEATKLSFSVVQWFLLCYVTVRFAHRVLC